MLILSVNCGSSSIKSAVIDSVDGRRLLEARIESFEIAFRMQTEATDAFDISKEPQEIKDLYDGVGKGTGTGTSQMAMVRGSGDLGAKLLVARRLVERGTVRAHPPHDDRAPGRVARGT